MKLRLLLRVITFVAGVALAAYGIWLLVCLDTLSFAKFSADGRDTLEAALVILFGVAIALYALFDSPSSRQEQDSKIIG